MRIINFIIACIYTAIERALSLCGIEIFLEPDAPQMGFFDFEVRDQGDGNCEYFGLGQHLIVANTWKTRKISRTA